MPWMRWCLMWSANVGGGLQYFRACRRTQDLVCPLRTTLSGTVRSFPAILTRTGFTLEA